MWENVGNCPFENERVYPMTRGRAAISAARPYDIMIWQKRESKYEMGSDCDRHNYFTALTDPYFIADPEGSIESHCMASGGGFLCGRNYSADTGTDSVRYHRTCSRRLAVHVY